MLSEAGQLLTLEQAVSTEFEIAACLAEADCGPALRFDRVNGYAMPIVGNMLNSLPRIAMGLGTTPASLQRGIVAAVEAPLAHRLLASAPCQEEIIVDPKLARRIADPTVLREGAGRLYHRRRDRRQGPAHRPDQSFDRAADAARRQPRVRRHRAKSSSRGAGAAARDAARRSISPSASAIIPPCWWRPVSISGLAMMN